jgi:hypothetical protein
MRHRTTASNCDEAALKNTTNAPGTTNDPLTETALSLSTVVETTTGAYAAALLASPRPSAPASFTTTSQIDQDARVNVD